ncbi:sulfatase-like hydrolase/transferase [Epibacterium ulvae]|uniref:sulfatase-like hydrolase/transferase n=1 Tax=Epibacterium ulvae TaxID=1156985 RepID=UPI00248FCDF6|nr:sulfatase-like hydrolase/transferase [Epibacterium ulvae]
MSTKTKPVTRAGVVPVLLSALLLHLVFVLPNYPPALTWERLVLAPLELPLVLCVLLAMPRWQVLRVFLVALLSLIVVMKLADLGMFTALNRPFNPVADYPLLGSLVDLGAGAFGKGAAWAAVAVCICALNALIGSLWGCTGYWMRLSRPRWSAYVSGVIATGLFGLIVVDVGAQKKLWEAPFAIFGTSSTARFTVNRVQTVHRTLTEWQVFKAAVANDPLLDQPDLLAGIDRDVLVIFVESYGRTSLDTPYYAELHRRTLEEAEERLGALGLSMASTILTSPTRGGQSWLAHSTFSNGLWIDDQIRYRAALTSGRQTLFHLAQQAGLQTGAVMPQITLDWPEVQFMGFDTVFAAKDLGYAGKPFNWVTMPDQFTFAAMDRLLRAPNQDGPMMIQMALGSSHAPWVPVPELVPWETIGDGRIYDPVVEAGATPREVWKDHDRVRAQYKRAVDYALQTVMAYAELHAKDPPLMIIVGDHQAAGFVALEERADVPMHVIGPKHLVDAIADAQFYQGLTPPSEAEPRPMDEMRAHLVKALSFVGTGVLVR